MKAQTIIRLRKLSQIIFLLVFVFSIFWFSARLQPQQWGRIFFIFNPLLVLAGSIGGRILISGFFISFIFIFAAVLLGRAWCGWLCPLGTALEWVHPKPKKSGWVQNQEKFRQIKYLVLGTILFLAVLGSQLLIVFDPVTLFYRTISQSGLPALKSVIFSAETLLYRIEPLWDVLDWLHTSLILPVFGDARSLFQFSLLIFLFFVAVVGMNWITERFWCRNVCPLGALTGLFSKLTFLRRNVNDQCTSCGKCARNCPTGAVNPDEHYSSNPSECILCYECTAVCQFDANPIQLSVRNWKPAEWKPYDPNRRTLLAGAGLALGAAALAAIDPSANGNSTRLIRPPGISPDLGSLCIRCGVCINVCPTHGLQSSGLEDGWEMLFTPQLVPRLGACDYNCTACTEVCPTQAIRPISLEEKRSTPIGLARIDQDRCLPWAYNTPCLICEEACPLPEKAIRLVEEQAFDQYGSNITLQRPSVIRENCIGCGVCEHQCPVSGEGAIRVFSPNQNLNLPYSF